MRGGTGFADGQFHHFAVVRQGTANNNITYYKDDEFKAELAKRAGAQVTNDEK